MLRKTLSLFFVFAFYQAVEAQEYQAMMDDFRYSIPQVKAAAEKHFEAFGKEEGSGYKGYQRWLWENEYKYGKDGDRSKVDPYFLQKEWQKVQSGMEQVQTATWQDLGPYTIDSITGHYSPGLGRVECFYVDPNDSTYLYLGSRSGGFWRSTNRGQTWSSSTTDFLPASGVNTMAVNPSNRDSVLINLRNARNGTSQGIYRSVDGGLTWTATAFNPTNISWAGLGENGQVYQLLYHPTIKNKLYIGTNRGLYISNDDLQTWSLVEPSADITHIKFHPTDDQVVYVYDDYYWGNYGDVLRISSDGGQTFSSSDSLLGNNGSNVEIAVSPACPDCLYAASANGVWKSTDKGQNFTFMSNPSGVCDGFAVSDVDTSIMIYGMLDIFRSTNGGQSFNQVTTWFINQANPFSGPQYVHADLREIEARNGEFYIGTDGYLAVSQNQGQDWQRLSRGTGIRENYSIGIAQSELYTTVAGSQDNGTSIYREEGWVEFYGADGMEGVVHPLNSDWFMGSVQFGTRRLSFDGGASQQGATPSGQSGSWEAPLDRSSTDHFTLYHFGDVVYESNDFGLNWNTKGSPVFSGEIVRAAVAPNDGSILAVSRGDDFEMSFNGGNTFRRRSTGLPTNETITDIAFAPHSDSIIVLTYGAHENDGQKVFISFNQGLSWSNITHNLGDMPIRTVVMDDSPDHNIYLGAEIGVYVKPLNGNTWALYNSGLPNMTVTDLEIMHGANLLRAATWGRGMWQIPLKDRASYPRIETVSLEHRATFRVPTDIMAQQVTAQIGYGQAIDTVWLQWSAGRIGLDSLRGMVYQGDSIWQTLSPIPAQALGTDVYFKVFAVGASQDTSISFRYHYRVQDTGLCQVTGGNGLPSSYLSQVVLPGMSNASGRSRYTDINNKYASMQSGQTYTLSADVLNANPGDSVHAWLDLNGNRVFEREEYVDFGPLDAFGNTLAQYTMPHRLGVDTVLFRIRIQAAGQTADPCNLSEGETEDYRVIVVGRGLNQSEQALNLPVLFPNPAQSTLNLENLRAGDFYHYRIFDRAGALLQQSSFTQDALEINIDQLSPGLYLLEIDSKTGSPWVQNFIKE